MPCQESYPCKLARNFSPIRSTRRRAQARLRQARLTRAGERFALHFPTTSTRTEAAHLLLECACETRTTPSSPSCCLAASCSDHPQGVQTDPAVKAQKFPTFEPHHGVLRQIGQPRLPRHHLRA